jgi:hypothetical protein
MGVAAVEAGADSRIGSQGWTNPASHEATVEIPGGTLGANTSTPIPDPSPLQGEGSDEACCVIAPHGS